MELVIVVRAGTQPQRIVVEEALRSGATVVVLERYKFPLLSTILYVYVVAFSIYIPWSLVYSSSLCGQLCRSIV
jgi:hypothetical protein